MSSFRRLCSTRLPVQKPPIRLNRILPIAAAAPVRIITDQSLSRPDRSKRRRFANRAEVLEGPFERRIQQFETEIDFGIGRSQWRGNAHDPIGCARCVRCWRSVRMQRILGDRIRKRASKVLLAAVKRLEFYSQEQVPPRTSPIQAYLC